MSLTGAFKRLVANRKSNEITGRAAIERAAMSVVEGLESRQLLSAAVFPNITVLGKSNTAIAYQDSTPSTTDGTDFGSVDTKKNAVQSFVIKNTGAGTLNLTAFSRVQVTGADAADFAVTAQPAAVVAPNASTTFSLKFAPSHTGAEHATVTIYNDTDNKDPFTFDVGGTGSQVGKAQVYGNNKFIPVNDTTISATDNTSFGSVETATGTASKTFTMKNLGSGTLTLTGTPKVAISGTDASSFSVTTQPSGTIAANGSSDFVIKFQPVSAGVKNAVVTITTDDTTAATYKFNISGTATNAPVMRVVGNSNPINTGSTTPSASNYTDFGSADLVTGTVTKTFQINNIGSAALSLTGSPIVAITGDGKSAFSVVAQPSNSIAVGSNLTFQIKFAPGSVGTKNALVTIANNDGGKLAPYTFAITGTAVSVPTIDVQGGATSVDLTSGQTTTGTTDGTDFGNADITATQTTHTFTIKDLSSGALHLNGTPKITVSGADAADFSITQPTDGTLSGKTVTRVASGQGTGSGRTVSGKTLAKRGKSKHPKHDRLVAAAAAKVGTAPAAPNSTTFGVTFDPTTVGTKHATVTIASDDATTPSYTFDVSGTSVSTSVLGITGAGQNVANGSTTPAANNLTDFGNVDINSNASRGWTLADLGSQDLAITGGVVLGGANASDFTVTTDATGSITAGSTAPIVIKFAPTTVGVKTATVTLTTDDPASPFTFTIKGTAVSVPRVGVMGNSTGISAGDTTPSVSDDTDFGSTELAQGFVTKTFALNNYGSNTLNLTGAKVTLTGANAGDFAITSVTPASIAGGGSGTTNLTIKFRPTAAGVRNATVNILSNDPSTPTFSFAIRGTAVRSPVATVSGLTHLIASGDTTPSGTDGTDFGSTDTAAPVTHTFSIKNIGSDALDLNGSPIVAISGTDAADFTLTSRPRVSLGANGTTTFDLTFTPSTAAAETATVTIASDDPATPSYTFDVTGTGALASHMVLKGGSAGTTVINTGDTTPSITDGSDFGQSVINTGTVSNTFVVANLGGAALNFSGSPAVTISGANAADFSVTTQPTGPVTAVNGTTSFVVKFAPTAAGIRNATITIATDDPASPYVFSVRGTGITAPAMKIEGSGTTIPDGDTTPDTADLTDFGDTELANGTVTQTFTIRNAGSAALNLTTVATKLVTIAGANAADFTLVTPPAATVAAGATTTFAIKFKPSAVGQRNATVSLQSNDVGTSPYTFTITGNAVQQPVLSVIGNGKTMVNGQTATATDGSDFGSAKANSGTVSKTFTIKNIGSAALNLTGTNLVDLSGPDAADFAVTTPPAVTTLAAGASTTFTITYTPTDVAVENAVVSINSDDATGSFVFNIKGTGTAA